MPRGDGTGPRSQGVGTGRRDGSGQNQMSNSVYIADGYCICPKCGKKLAHQFGVPCLNVKCPNCNASMTRE
jgi:hypothetical protein